MHVLGLVVENKGFMGCYIKRYLVWGGVAGGGARYLWVGCIGG